MAQTVKHLSTMWEIQARSLGQEDPLDKEMAIHSSTIAWKSHGQRSLVGYSPWGRKESDTTERLYLTNEICEPTNPLTSLKGKEYICNCDH